MAGRNRFAIVPVADATTTFGEKLPKGTFIFDETTQKIKLLTENVISTDTLTIATTANKVEPANRGSHGVDVKTTDYTVKISDDGITLVMNSASAQIFTFLATTGNVGFKITFIKLGAGDVRVSVDDSSDVIADFVVGEGIENIEASEIGSSVTLQIIANNKIAIVSRDGTWVTTSAPPPAIVNGFVATGLTAVDVKNIEKFTLAVGSFTVSSHGDALNTSNASGGTSSATQGFIHGASAVEKFDLTTQNVTSAHGGLSSARTGDGVRNTVGVSTISSGFGYAFGGGPTEVNIIDKYAFSSNTTAADVGDLSVAKDQMAGFQSSVEGFCAGGFTTIAQTKVEKLFFSTDANTTSHGDLSAPERSAPGTSSANDGYMMGGLAGGLSAIVIKFNFSGSFTSASIGDMTVAKRLSVGISGATHGFCATGFTSINVSDVQRTDFSVDAVSVNIGSLTSAKRLATGHQK